MVESSSFFNETQFLLAVKGLGLASENIEIARRILVGKQSRQEVMQSAGLTKQRISQIIQAVIGNFEKQLNAHNLVFVSCVVDEANSEKVKSMENDALAWLFN